MCPQHSKQTYSAYVSCCTEHVLRAYRGIILCGSVSQLCDHLGRLTTTLRGTVLLRQLSPETSLVGGTSGVSDGLIEVQTRFDGITAVVDTGLAKMNFYDPRTYTSSLVETTISRASADQRRGRAGR